MRKIILLSIVLGLSLAGAVSGSAEDPADWGNTSSNLTQGGRVAYRDGYLYYANPYDDDKLYKMRLAGFVETKLSDDQPTHINVVGQTIYYLNSNPDTKAGFYAMGTGGRPRVLIDDSLYGFLRVDGAGLAYFLQDGQVFRLATNAPRQAKEKMFDEDEITTMAVDTLYIYYTKWWEKERVNPSYGGLYVYHRTEKEVERLVHFNHRIREFTKSDRDRWVYFYQTGGYTNNAYDGVKQYATGLFRLTEDAKQPRRIAAGDRGWALIEDWIYYSKNVEGGQLFRIKTDGTLDQRVSGILGDVYEAGEHIVVRSANKMTLMLKDGRQARELK